MKLMVDINPDAALREAIALAGSQAKLAAICGCTQAAISQMLARQQPMLSVQFVLRVEAALGVARHHLRPDIYPEAIAEPVSVEA